MALKFCWISWTSYFTIASIERDISYFAHPECIHIFAVCYYLLLQQLNLPVGAISI